MIHKRFKILRWASMHLTAFWDATQFIQKYVDIF
jgi:hypothetical protein